MTNDYKDANITWLQIKHNRLFDHIIALGSRVDLLVTANSIFIAALFILVSSSEHQQKIGSTLPILCFSSLCTSLFFCIVTIFLRVRPHMYAEDFFEKEKVENLEELIDEVHRYAERAKQAIDRRHLIIYLAAFTLFTGLGFLTWITIVCL